MNRLILRGVKKLLLGSERRIFRMRGGFGKGLNFWIDPNTNAQRIMGFAEAEIASDFARLATSASTFVDVGASDGYYPISVANMNRTARIIGCEPRAEMQEIYESNLKANDIRNPSRIHWICDHIGINNVRLDDLLKDAAEPILLKIDVDGAEMDVLKSAKNTLSRAKCSVILETHSHELERDCASLFAESGFETSIIGKAWWRVILPELRPLKHNRWMIAEK